MKKIIEFFCDEAVITLIICIAVMVGIFIYETKPKTEVSPFAAGLTWYLIHGK
jgi:hypothetical protein